MTVFNSDLYVTGNFHVAGDKNSDYIARWLASKPEVEPEPIPMPHFMLNAAYPNPFNGGTHARFRLNNAAQVTLTIHDIRGRLVSTLIDERLHAEIHEALWDDRGAAMPSGLYLFRLHVEGVLSTGKVVLVR